MLRFKIKNKYLLYALFEIFWQHHSSQFFLQANDNNNKRVEFIQRKLLVLITIKVQPNEE